jgi:hypothetical protein
LSTYVFRVRFTLDTRVDVRTDPREFETVVTREAPAPDDEAWPLFESWLWHGELTDERHFRREVESWLNVPVASASFSELRVTPSEREALEAAVEADLDRFDADSVREVLHRHLGSSLRVVEEEDT